MKNKAYIKAFLLSAFVLILFASCHLSNNKKTNVADPSQMGAFKFDDDEYNFGVIKDGDTVSHVFTYSNVGKAPLVIYDISTGCGCTVAQWTDKPVLPGKTGQIKVQFSKHHDPGVHTKLIVIKANIKEVYYVVKVMAEVQK
jgi:hypothetical protein